MGRIGKIVPIRKEYSKSSTSLDACLASHGFTRFPGTTMKIMPAKSPSGDYLTGLDPNAIYIKRMPQVAADIEKKRVSNLREELESATNLDLSPRALYYKEMMNDSLEQLARATVVMLKDEPNIFDLEDPYQAITFAWLSAHPLIANSYEAWERGEYPPTTKFYVANDEIEQEIAYRKNNELSEALVILKTMSLEDRKKAARLLGNPLKDDAKEAIVYNILYKHINEKSILEFMGVAKLDAKMLSIRDLISQAINLDIYRKDSDGSIREGGLEISKSETDLGIELSKTKNQDKVVVLSDKITAKKLLEY